MITRMQVVEQARTWIGTPYAHQGRLKDVGVDCIGLPLCVARELGLVEVDFNITGYTRSPDGKLMPMAQQYMTRITHEQMQFGDIIVLAMPKEPRHFGIISNHVNGGFGIIHAYGKKVHETRLMTTSALRFVAAFHIPGVEA